MKAEEFRIGNCILFGEICKISEIQKNCFYVENKDNVEFKSTNCELQPIPLTEEILLKCGFKDQERANEINYYRMSTFQWVIIERIVDGFRLVINRLQLIEIKYLHQLQNLIYSLTGTELEINI